jgi:uncharacterized delta-60 repeat protein
MFGMSAFFKRVVPSLELLERRVTPSAGALDPTFGVGGLVRTPFPVGGIAHAAAVQADGKIVVAGESDGSFALARYNPDGSLDSTFDHDGKVTTVFGGGDGAANAVAIQADGKIVVAGTAGGEFAVARYNADGSLDKTFDHDGTLTTDILAVSYATSIAIQADGKIVAAGAALQGGFGPGAGQTDIAVARYNLDGTLDKTFDRDGTVTTYWGSNDLVGSGVAVQGDGKIVVAGTMTTSQLQASFVVVRYNGDGTFDRSFHGGSVSTAVGPGGYAAGLALQHDGKILVAGDTRNIFTPSHLVVARYQGNGDLDTGFGTQGLATAGFGWGSDTEAGAVAVQADGKILVAGQTAQGPRFDFALVRFTASGAPDAAFAGGKTTATFGSTADGNALVLQSDGKAVVAGDSNGGFALARFDLGPGAVQNLVAVSQVTLTSSAPGWAPFGQPVTLTAVVAAGNSRAGTPTGYVSFMEGSSWLGARPLLNGSAKLTGLQFGPGQHRITAVYTGAAGFSPDTSAVLTQTVKATTLTYLVATPVFARNDQPVAVTATVLATSPTTKAPSGTVILKEGNQVLGTAKLGPTQRASWSLGKLGVGTYTLMATYQGDDNFAPSTSQTFSVTVLRALGV